MQARIMVVDDEAATGRLLLYQLRSLGYEALYLQDGLQALQRVLLEQPDLILLDVMMPHISGWDVCREIRTCSAVPIIMLTAKDAEDDIVTGLMAGADDYVTKPFTMAQLNARIEAVMRRSDRARAPAQGRQAYSVPHPPASELRAAARPAATSHSQAPRVAGQPFHPQRTGARQAPQLQWEEPAPARPAPADPAPRQAAQGAPMRLGQRLRAARQERGISLYQAECGCRVRWDYLQAIEQENWDYAPRARLRLALLSYARYLNIDLAAFSAPRPTLAQRFEVQMAAVMALALALIVVAFYAFYVL